MNIYLVEPNGGTPRGFYKLMLVVCENEEIALNTYPDQKFLNKNIWKVAAPYWFLPKFLKVTLLGKADDKVEPGVILAVKQHG